MLTIHDRNAIAQYNAVQQLRTLPPGAPLIDPETEERVRGIGMGIVLGLLMAACVVVGVWAVTS